MIDGLDQPAAHDHRVQLYQEPAMLAEAVREYIGGALRRGDGALIIATPAHRALFVQGLEDFVESGQLSVYDAEETLARIMVDNRPDWRSFQHAMGGLIAEVRLQYPGVCAYGEMVDVLWQRGNLDAALRLEEFWNELARLQTFSLFCAYRMDPLDTAAYGGPLEGVCRAHSHLIPAHDTARFDAAVSAASVRVLDPQLAQILLALASHHATGTQMPTGQAALFWLRQNMPRTADKVLRVLRDEASPAG
jgi:MEDS: MEthanogen/methylotroph, DcmR Sensory domain